MNTGGAERPRRLETGTKAKEKKSPQRTEPPQHGVLSDAEIISECSKGGLVVRNFDPERVKQSCYELRVGSVYYDLNDDSRRIDLEKDGYVLLKPFQQVAVITQEELSLPADMVGRVLLKGRMFSLGIAPVHTYADPGFSGRLGIVLFNLSRNYLKLDQGSPIAKLEFERLAHPVERPYTGQHGFQSEIWPVPKHLVLSDAEIGSDPRVGTLGAEIGRAFGDELATLVNRIFRYERRLLLSVLFYTLAVMVIIAFSAGTGNELTTLLAFGVGLVTNLASTILVFLATSLGKFRN